MAWEYTFDPTSPDTKRTTVAHRRQRLVRRRAAPPPRRPVAPARRDRAGRPGSSRQPRPLAALARSPATRPRHLAVWTHAPGGNPTAPRDPRGIPRPGGD